MLSLERLVSFLDATLEIDKFTDYCPNGLQVEGTKTIKKIGFSVSLTLECLEQALENKVDSLVVHHGIFWKHQGARPLTGAHFKRVKKLIDNNISLLAYHLPLDAHLELGNARGMADICELTNISSFGNHGSMPLGLKGEFHSKISANKLKEKLEKAFNRSIILATANDSRLLQSIGIITGGANNNWGDAVKLNLDAYLTGEISEYNWHDAIEEGVDFFACGHHATETFGVKSLMRLCAKEFGVEGVFIDSLNLV
jgi:dinuclear metal center YbgI/SA1388 family protein